MTRKTVTVVIPTIPGREAELERAVLSVKAQTRQPDHVVVEYDSERTGAAQARNRALARVTTDYVAWLDDDDLLRDSHLRTLMRVVEYPRGSFDPVPDLVYPTPVIAPHLDPTAVTVSGQLRLPWGVRFGPEQAAYLRRQGSFIPMTHLVRTEAVRDIDGFQDGYWVDGRYRGEDEDYLIRLLDRGAVFEHINRKTWIWNAHPATSTAGRADRN
jgi:glycosyltransferase involved in cell wall biosynthesis